MGTIRGLGSAIAELDRQVLEIRSDASPARRYRLSELADVPSLVLLGEPGSGKTTVLHQLAREAGTTVVTVRALLAEPERLATSTMFVDALDQSRSDETADDRIDRLGVVLRERAVSRWRLSCRVEDWRGPGDLQAFVPAGDDAPRVVQLLPLDLAEAASVLRAFGHRAPGTFLLQAQDRGAAAFLESPLMLRLLHAAVGEHEEWPTTRAELFERAVGQLAAEHDPARSQGRTRRAGTKAILDAGGMVSLLMLTAGAEALWRSSVPPPPEEAPYLLLVEDCGLDPNVLDDLIDSALVRGEGIRFALAHRTIAEWLAGRVLAMAVTGDGERAAFPLGRALALVADVHGKAPTELRGLHAWFAVHLQRSGREADACRLLEADPVSSLFYGDVASLDTSSRRRLFEALDADDPFFGVQAPYDSAVGGLAGEDLAADFQRVLDGETRDDHRSWIVLEALAGGVPIPSLASSLETIVVDEERPEHQRRRAIQARLRAASDPNADARRLFDALGSLPLSHEREGLRAALLVERTDGMRDTHAIVDVLVAYGEAGYDRSLSRLHPLAERLGEEPRPEVLDALAALPSLPWRHGSASLESRAILTALFVHALEAMPTLAAPRLLRWIEALAPDAHAALEPEAVGAVARWLDRGPEREIVLFGALRARDGLGHGRLENAYRAVTGRPVSNAIMAHLMRAANSALDPNDARALLNIAVEVLDGAFEPPLTESFWRLHGRLLGDRRHEALLERLVACPIPAYRQKALARAERERLAVRYRRRRRSRTLRRHGLRRLRDGRLAGPVAQAAVRYLKADGAARSLPGLEAVKERYADDVTEAIVDRWGTLARNGLGAFGPAEFGTEVGNGKTRWGDDLSALAGLHRLLERGDIDDPCAVPPIVLLCALYGRTWISMEADRMTLERFVVAGLADSAEARGSLKTFWLAALEAGATRLPGVYLLLSQEDQLSPFGDLALSLLADRPDLPPVALRETISLVRAAGRGAELSALVTTVLGTALAGEQRDVWLELGVHIDPFGVRDELRRTVDVERLTEVLVGDTRSGGFASLANEDAAAALEREVLVIECLAPHVEPDEKRDDDGVVTDAVLRQDGVRRALQRLGADGSREARMRTRALLDDERLVSWRSHIRHALARQDAVRRDAAFRRPSAAQVRKALDGGPPLNAEDLRAIAGEELIRLGATLHTGATMWWKAFWNTDRHGKVTADADEFGPKIENECRNRILERFGDALERYGIRIVMPEGARGEGTRADMLVFSATGSNVPFEIKRHDHPRLWVAASEQLQGYASAPGADGRGLYLVLWFGSAWRSTPKHPKGQRAPRSAVELQTQLDAVLPESIRSTTDVIVFDIEPPSSSVRCTS